jgi:hypothetical protein
VRVERLITDLGKELNWWLQSYFQFLMYIVRLSHNRQLSKIRVCGLLSWFLSFYSVLQVLKMYGTNWKTRC